MFELVVLVIAGGLYRPYESACSVCEGFGIGRDIFAL
jgi:hypothetical protein